MITKTMIEPRGRAPRLTREEIASLSVITDQDIRRAKAKWRKLMPGRWRGLISARIKSPAD